MILLLAYLSLLTALGSGMAALLNGRLRPGTQRGEAGRGQPARGLADNAVHLLLGLSGLLAVLAGGAALLNGGTSTGQLPLGLPWLHWHTRLDALSGFFLAVIGIAVLAASLYAPGYVRDFRHGKYSSAVLGLATALFVVGMELVLLADDAFSFVIAWELMSVSSYFLVAFQHEHAANRRAAFLYLLMAEVGAIAIILAYGVIAAFAHGFGFDALRATHLSAAWGSVAFALALFGFGMKAGLVPVHAWLPEAHPVAPSHISGLMSGVMLKVAVYGLIRFSYDLLGDMRWEWGVAVLLLGTASAVLGVLYAMLQNNLKRLLAYSSIENVGIIFVGLGLSMIFLGTGQSELGVLGLVAALYHALNHSLFKNLLFLSAGSVLHQTHEHDLEQMGGLIKRMPKTAILFLIGSLSISALPPLNGFVSEWLIFQAALQAPALDSGVLRGVIPVAAAALAFAGAVAATCFVKVFGVAFLGLPRSRHAQNAREVAHPGMLWGPGLLAVLCFLTGVFPTAIVDVLENIPQLLLGASLPSASAHGWLWLTPGGSDNASYAAPLVMLAVMVAGWVSLRLWRHSNDVRRAVPWDCGFGGLNARMQYTATAFAQPLRRIFQPLWEIRESIESEPSRDSGLQPGVLHYRLEINDHSWRSLYLPISRGVDDMARRVSRIQTGQIRTYIAYSFFTLLILLWVVS